MTIIKNTSQLADADMASLVESYNHYTGATTKRFSSLEVGRRKVEMAMMSAKDADAQTGVPPGSNGEPKGRADIVKKAKAKGLPIPPSLDEEVNFAPDTLGAELTKQVKEAKPIAPRPKAEPKAPGTPRKLMFAVQATFAGTSTPQAGSVRNSVLLRIQQAPNNAATIADLDSHFDCDTRGYVNKLIEKNHLVLLDEAAYAAAKPVKGKK